MGFDAWAGRWLPRWWRWPALTVLCLVALLPGLTSLPATDRDEARFAQATRQMVASGDIVDIRFQDEPRYKKPIGIYWLQAAVVGLAGEDPANPIWVYRLPSLLGALVAVLATFGFGRRLVGDDGALLAAALLAVSIALGVEARLAKTDAVLLAAVTIAMGAFGSLYAAVQAGMSPSRKLALAGWAALGFGTLVKGPVAPLIAILAIGTLAVADRGTGRTPAFLRALCWRRGLILFLAVVLPWAVAITLASDGAFWNAALGQDLAPKLAGGAESHGAPPGYHLVVGLGVMLWPGSLLLGLAAPWLWQRRHTPGLRFLLAWAIPAFLVFEAIPTKLPHYTLPLFPAFLLMAASQLRALSWPAETAAGRAWRQLCLACFALVALAMAAGLAGSEVYFGRPGLAGPVAVVAAGGLVWAVWRYAAVPDPRRMIGAAVAGAVLLLGLAFGAVAPTLAPLWPARSIAAVLQQTDPTRQAPLVASGYAEPSLVFATGGAIRLTGPEAAAAAVAADPTAIAVVESRRRAAFDAALGAVRTQVLGHVSGLNISRGEWLDIDLLRQAP